MSAESENRTNVPLTGPLFIGIDVQRSRQCPYAIFDANDRMLASGWLEGPTDDERCRSLLAVADEFRASHAGLLAFGIDSPRLLRPNQRNYYVDRRRTACRERRGKESGVGRLCEVVVKSCNIANPQWTPVVDSVPPTKNGCKLA